MNKKCVQEKISFLKREIKPYLKPLSILFLFSFLAIFSLLRANYNYYDDLGRVAMGYRGWSNFSRYLSSFFSIFLHGDTYLTDISPWPQILALFLMSLASLILLKVFTHQEKFSFWNIISVFPLAINPYFLECLSYKYDAPYMAFSVLVSILPLLFAKQKTGFYAVVIFFCTLMMCATYQASSGIFIIVVFFYALSKWLKGTSFKECFYFVLKSLLFYLSSLLIFKIFFMQTSDTYVTNILFSIKEIPMGFIKNLSHYYTLFIKDFKIEWLILIIGILLSFISTAVLKSKKSKIKTLGLTFLVLFLSILLCFGIYPAFTEPLYSPRAMYGIGVLLTMLMIFCCDTPKNFLGKIFSLSLVYCFFAFSFTYGNALNAQKEYTDMRIELVLSDLNELELAKTSTIKKVQIIGNIGYSPVILNMPEDFAMLERLVPLTFGGENVWYQASFFYYSNLKNMIPIPSNEKIPPNLPLLKDTMFHEIRGNEEYICISLK